MEEINSNISVYKGTMTDAWQYALTQHNCSVLFVSAVDPLDTDLSQREVAALSNIKLTLEEFTQRLAAMGVETAVAALAPGLDIPLVVESFNGMASHANNVRCIVFTDNIKYGDALCVGDGYPPRTLH